jgi:hypothetical protein
VNKYRHPAVPFTGVMADRAERSAVVRNITGIGIGSGFFVLEKTLPAIPERPWDEQSDAEFWAGNFRRAMYFERRVLDRPDDWGDMEFMKMKRQVALETTAQTVRMRIAELRPPGDDAVVSRLMERVERIRRGERVIEIDPGDVSE